jgi:hypothetical protein
MDEAQEEAVETAVTEIPVSETEASETAVSEIPVSETEASEGESDIGLEGSAAQVEEAPTPSQDASGATVLRAVLTTAVEEREPIDQIETLTNDNGQIVFFTELGDAEGQTITHRWEFQGEVIAEVSLDIGSARWRTYSSKRLDPAWLGEWKVSVVDESGGILDSATFTYTEAAEIAEPETEPASEVTTESPAAPLEE